MRPWLLAVAFAALPACKEGSGSDIGPNIVRDPIPDFRALVRDDAGRAVCGAVMTVDGESGEVVTGNPGRATWPAELFGTRLLRIDGAAASATDTDLPGSLAVRIDASDGREPAFVIHLPDLAPSASLALPAGTLVSTRVLDDSASSGAVLTIPAGTSVGAGGASSVTVRTGKLSAGHLPPLPSVASGARLAPLGVLVAPSALTLAPAATLKLPNAPRLLAGTTADVLYLDPQNGSWTVLGTAAVTDAATTLTAAGVVTRGGLYVFATTVAATVRLEGRVLDTDDQAVEGAFVSAGEAKTKSNGDGRWVLDGIAATWANGVARDVQVEIFGGFGRRSARLAFSVALQPGVQDTGDRVLEAPHVGIVKLLQVNAGKRVPEKRLRVSSTYGLSYAFGIGDEGGEVRFEEQEDGYLGTNGSWPKDYGQIYLTESTTTMRRGDPTLDLRVFGHEFDWWIGRPHGVAVYPLDSRGSGIIADAKLSRGSEPRSGYVSRGPLVPGSVDYGMFGEVTAAVESRRPDQTVISAMSFMDPDNGHAEFPLERAVRGPVGAFDRHGRIVGNLTGGSGAGKAHRVRVTRRLTIEDWFDSAWFGRDVLGSVPRKLDPETTAGLAFDLGVPTPRGNVAALEGTTSGGKLVLERIGLESGLRPTEGRIAARDVALALPCDSVFALPSIFSALDPRLSVTDFALDLGAELTDGSIIDVGRGFAFNAVPGTGSFVLLPSLAAAGASRWLTSIRGTASAGGKTLTQMAFVPFSASSASTTLFPVPDITSPAPGATLPATGFTVAYTVPAGTTYLEAELRSVLGQETRVWHAVIYPDYPSYTFRELPAEMAQPLVGGGRIWTLTVSAFRIPGTDVDTYRRAVGHWVGITEAERGVDAVSSTSITVTTQ